MRFHWYWPFARPEELDWAVGTARDGESILVEVIDRAQAPAAGTHGPVTVVRDLPDVRRDVGNRLAWTASRANTYRARAAIRRTHWGSGKFDLVHLHYVNRFTDAFAPLPHPLVMSVHDVVPHMPRLGTGPEHRLLERLYSRADALVVHHQELTDRLVSDFRISGDRIHVVPHQVFPVGDVPDLPPEGPPTVLFFGALRPNKGLDVLADAMGRLQRDDVRLVIAGRGDPELERLATDLAAGDSRVRAEIGFATLGRKRELFGEASLVVMPYTSFASQSGVLHDAYGHCRPVVVSDVGALGDTVREDDTGLVVPPKDPSALSDAIRASLEPTTWRNHAAAERRIRAERSPPAIGARLREVYDCVLP
jgi:glycosyltransferase involved in cell wall biosynthesis